MKNPKRENRLAGTIERSGKISTNNYFLRKIASIFCEEFQYDKDDIVEVCLSDDGKTVWVHFDSGTIGFASELLWDKNVRETFRKNFEVD